MKCGDTAQKMKFSNTYLFSKYDQICSFLRIWSHLLKKPVMKNIFCAGERVKLMRVVTMNIEHSSLNGAFYSTLS